jgi:hypothetical protein
MVIQMRKLPTSSSKSPSTLNVTLSSTEASTHEGDLTMKKFAKVIAHSALVATLLTLLSTAASASAVWGN